MNFIKLQALTEYNRPFDVHLRADVITQVHAVTGHQVKGNAVVITYQSVVTVRQTPTEVMDLIRNADFQEHDA